MTKDLILEILTYIGLICACGFFAAEWFLSCTAALVFTFLLIVWNFMIMIKLNK